MKHLTKNAITLMALALVAGACAPAAQLRSTAEPRSVASTLRTRTGHLVREATIKVINNNWATMNVYAVRAGSRVRLGTVTSMASSVFRLPRSMAGIAADVRLVADPIGSSQAYTSPAVRVGLGQQIAFTIENALNMSSVAVWNR